MTTAFRVGFFILLAAAAGCSHKDPSSPEPPDGRVPPARITDLAVDSESAISVNLRWKAPGADLNVGQATAYDLRYAIDTLTVETWDQAIRVQGVPAPKAAGRAEHYTVTGLRPYTSYAFAVRAADEDTLWSEVSNVAVVRTGSLLRLTTSASVRIGARRPRWSPAGDTIAFAADWKSSPDSPRTQLYLINAAVGEPVQLTHQLSDGADAPAWSPDGRRLAFVCHVTEGLAVISGISVMDAVPYADTLVLSVHRNTVLCGPSWFRDGSHVAYGVSSMSGSNPEMGGHVVAVSSRSRTGFAAGWNFSGSVSCSPVDDRIAFSSNHGGNFDIWVVDAAGGEPTPLTDDPASDVSPAWSPDGSRIAFSSDRGGTWDIWIISASGENPVRITDGAGAETAPSWSPDGTRIAFSLAGSDHVSDIWVVYLPRTP
jgi:dipeptidyl aminopeptidase/acylaminoacyl peptidase